MNAAPCVVFTNCYAKAMTPKDDLFCISRRHFLRYSLGAAALAPLAACDGLGLNKDDDDPLFDGPTIAEDDFIAFNAGYYGIGVDSATQLPYTALRQGSPAARITDPVSIAYRLQHLLADSRHIERVDTILSQLLTAQIDARPPDNYRNMIPRLAIQSDGVVPTTKDYSFVQNALLASRVAMAAQAHAGTATSDKALAFLEKQKLGYNQALAQSTTGFLPEFANAGLFGVDPVGMNLLFGGYYAAVAFVLAYYIGDTPIIGDPQVGMDTWQAMIDAQNGLMGAHAASTRASANLQVPLARNGSGYQYFHSLLTIDPAWLDMSMQNALYNVLFSFLDAAVYDRVPGIYSAGPHAGGFFDDNGLNRLAAKQRYHTSRETIVTTDALAAALRLFDEDSDERLILKGWIGLYATVDDVITPQGYRSGMDKEGTPINALYARQNGAMILFKSQGPALLNSFMVASGKPSMEELMGLVRLRYQDEPISRVESQLPVPLRIERLFTRV